MSSKTEEEVVFVPVDELEKELGSVVRKLMNELRKSHSRNRVLAKKLQSTEQRNAFTEERLSAMTVKKNKQKESMRNRIMELEENLRRLADRLNFECRRKRELEMELQLTNTRNAAHKESLERELNMLIDSIQSLNVTIKKKETELQEKEEVIQKKNCDMEALNKHISDSKIYIENLQSRLDDISEQKVKDDLLQKETMESLQSRVEQMETQKTKENLLHQETVEGLQSRIQEMSAENSKENIEHTDTVKKLKTHVDEEMKKRFELSYQYSQLIQAKQAPGNVTKQGDPENKIQSLLLLRQDKEQQTELSHHIEELSDEKRPTKLAEEFSELYDNEWTDAFEEVSKDNEEQKVDFMLKLLMRANEICRFACTEHTSAIKRSFCTLVVETDPTTGDMCGEVPGRTAPDSKGNRQATDDGHGRTNAAKQKKVIETDFEQTLRNEEKKTVMEIGKFFKQQLSEEVEKVGTEIILEEQNINQHSEAVAAYIRKCMNICWSMCRHMPPMHVDVPDVTGCIHFDTNKNKPYTKSGSYVHYIVWPALYLHEGGPVLCKGVAQGRK